MSRSYTHTTHFPVKNSNNQIFIDTRIDMDTKITLIEKKISLFCSSTLFLYTQDSKPFLDLLFPKIGSDNTIVHRDGNILDNNVRNLVEVENIPIEFHFSGSVYKSKIKNSYHHCYKNKNFVGLARHQEEAETLLWLSAYTETSDFYQAVPHYIERAVMLNNIFTFMDSYYDTDQAV